MDISIKKLSPSRIQATITLEDARVKEITDQSVHELGASIKIKGFRPGKAPKEILREHITEEKIHERVIQKEMPAIMQELTGKHELKPIIRPRVELQNLSPMTLIITLVEKPEAKVARKKIALPKGGLKEPKHAKAPASPIVADDKGDSHQSVKEKTPEEVRQEEDQALIDLIAQHTTVDLAPELISDEAEQLIEGHAQRMAQFGIKFEDWLSAQQKSIVDLIREMQPDAEKRLKIRFGVGALIQDLGIDIAENEMQQAIDTLLAPLTGVQHDELRLLYKPGARAYEQFKFQKKVEKLLEKLRAA